MPLFQISWLPFVAVALATFVLSWLWYSPLLFAKPWSRALGWETGHEMTEEEKRRMPFLFLSGLVSSLVFAYGLQVVIHSMGAATFAQGLVAGVVVWAAFALTHSLNTLWEGRKPLVLLINNGLFLLSYALFGGLVAVWR